jgi:hypothetical protein
VPEEPVGWEGTITGRLGRRQIEQPDRRMASTKYNCDRKSLCRHCVHISRGIEKWRPEFSSTQMRRDRQAESFGQSQLSQTHRARQGSNTFRSFHQRQHELFVPSIFAAETCTLSRCGLSFSETPCGQGEASATLATDPSHPRLEGGRMWNSRLMARRCRSKRGRPSYKPARRLALQYQDTATMSELCWSRDSCFASDSCIESY